MMIERPRTITKDHLKKIRENDRHFGEHEMTQVIDPRGRKPAHIAVTTSATTTTTANYSWQLLM